MRIVISDRLEYNEGLARRVARKVIVQTTYVDYFPRVLMAGSMSVDSQNSQNGQHHISALSLRLPSHPHLKL